MWGCVVEGVRRSSEQHVILDEVIMTSRPVQTCADCHFFIKEYDQHKFEIKSGNREAIRKQDYLWLGNHWALACYFGVWDEGYNFDLARRNEVIVETDRKGGDCFFWEYRPGMLFTAAEKLRQREANRVQGEKSANQLLKRCFEDFASYIRSEKRLTFWQSGNVKQRKWISRPEKHAKTLLHTFIAGRFGDSIYTFEEITSGAGRIDLFIISPNGEKVVVELKMCGHNYSENYAQEGMEQLGHYMENKETKTGYLIVFDSRVRDFAQGFQEVDSIDEMSITTLVVDVRPYVKHKDALGNV